MNHIGNPLRHKSFSDYVAALVAAKAELNARDDAHPTGDDDAFEAAQDIARELAAMGLDTTTGKINGMARSNSRAARQGDYRWKLSARIAKAA